MRQGFQGFYAHHAFPECFGMCGEHGSLGSSLIRGESASLSLKDWTRANGDELVEEYKHSLLTYWENGHGDILVLISELQGFLDCLIRLELIKKEDYMHIIDCFREEAKKIRLFN